MEIEPFPGTWAPGSGDAGVDVQYPWEDLPRRSHSHVMDIKSFLLDIYPVTCSKFQQFLVATGYKPADQTNFLKGWTGTGYPAGWAKKPVTWVSFEDATAYCSWAGKRLPQEWEWQFAAQGGKKYNRFPWGNGPDPTAMPWPQGGQTLVPPDDVDAHPHGMTLEGVADLWGNCFEFTNVWEDDHSRAAILRGKGSYYPSGSAWYFHHPESLIDHAKLLLLAPSIDRSGMVTFRCAVDL